MVVRNSKLSRYTAWEEHALHNVQVATGNLNLLAEVCQRSDVGNGCTDYFSRLLVNKFPFITIGQGDNTRLGCQGNTQANLLARHVGEILSLNSGTRDTTGKDDLCNVVDIVTLDADFVASTQTCEWRDRSDGDRLLKRQNANGRDGVTTRNQLDFSRNTLVGNVHKDVLIINGVEVSLLNLGTRHIDNLAGTLQRSTCKYHLIDSGEIGTSDTNLLRTGVRRWTKGQKVYTPFAIRVGVVFIFAARCQR